MKINLNKLIYSIILAVFFIIFYFRFDKILFHLGYELSDDFRVKTLKIVHALIWISVAYFINQLINWIYYRKYDSLKQKNKAPKLFKDIMVIVVYLIFITVIIGYVFKKPLTGFWATSSVAALVLGFALRNIILDLFSGIAVNMEQPYVVGNWIKIDQRFSNESLIGKVLDTNWRSTYLRTEENSLIIIPNSLITTQAVITNYSRDNVPTRFEVYFTLDFSVPVSRARRVLMAGALEANTGEGFAADYEPQVLLDKTNELGIVYKVRYWITPWQPISPSRSRNVIQTKILEHLDSAGLTLAYPKEDIYQASMPVRQLEAENETDRIKLLKKVDLFSILTDEEIENLSKRLLRKDIRKGTDVVRINESGDSMFILLEGLLDVTINNGSGLPLKVARITPGQYFGEMSMLTGELRSATVSAAVDSVIFEITREHFNEIISLRNNIVEKISDSIATRKNSNEKLLTEVAEDVSRLQDDYKQKLIRSIKAVFKLK